MEIISFPTESSYLCAGVGVSVSVCLCIANGFVLFNKFYLLFILWKQFTRIPYFIHLMYVSNVESKYFFSHTLWYDVRINKCSPIQWFFVENGCLCVLEYIFVYNMHIDLSGGLPCTYIVHTRRNITSDWVFHQNYPLWNHGNRIAGLDL